MIIRTTVLKIVFLFSFIAITAVSQPLDVERKRPLRIVVTNDDGIEDL